jgi:hypothetical protein
MRVHARSVLYSLIAGSVLFSSAASYGDIVDFLTELTTSKEHKEFESRLYGLWVTDAADAILLQPGQSLIAHDFVFTSSVWNGGSTEPLVAGTFETFYKEENTEQNMTCRAKYGATEKLMLFTIRFDRGQIVLKQRGFRGRSWRFN